MAHLFGMRKIQSLSERQFLPVLVFRGADSELVAMLAAARRCTCSYLQGSIACEQCKHSYVRVQTIASKLPYVTCIAPAAAACQPWWASLYRPGLATAAFIALDRITPFRRPPTASLGQIQVPGPGRASLRVGRFFSCPQWTHCLGCTWPGSP